MMETARQLIAWPRTPPFALLVDRDADTRKMYAEYLRLSACRTDEAEDGREALAKAITLRPDVVVTETRLPGISGFELCSLLRQDHTTRTTPIVVVTGDAFDEQVHRAKSCGADSVLVKPCLPETLLSEIALVLDRSAALREHAGAVLQQLRHHVARSNDLIEKSQATQHKKTMLSRVHDRRDTTQPPLAPPLLVCPVCDQTLHYQRSHVGGVSARHQEQWDYYECAGCGTFQYRQRTKKLRKV